MSKVPVIVAYGRSAATRAFKGSFAKMHPIEYGAQVLKGVLARVPQLDPNDIEDVIMGCAMPFNETAMNIAQLIANRAGLPDSVCGITINRFCSSGLQSISTACNCITAGEGDVYVAGGIEDMSMTFGKYDFAYDDKWLEKNYPGAYMSMGITAENVANKYNVTREQMDAFAVESHAKAAKAQAEGKLAPSIIPVVVTDHEGNPVLDENGNQIVVDKDEGIRAGTSMESLANLKPCFITDGTGKVTAGTSSQTNDCAAFVVVMSEDKAKSLGIKPLAKLRSFAVAGCNAEYMGLGPIYAVPKAMKRAGLTVEDMDVIEINEAFAAQSIPCINELKFPKEKVNPYGGAIALGHPLGCTGAILVGKAIDYMKENGGKYGLITMCIGGGMGAAGIIEML
ncbi:MAG: thiolase family protein [Oscillospiraceae bacterium]|jgi:acetyl-CoA acyltransferase